LLDFIFTGSRLLLPHRNRHIWLLIMATEATGNVLDTHPYTCNSCAVAFRNSDAQRTHMRSDWHRYNLKRKVADLPPVAADDFNQKVLNAQASTTAAQEQASYAKSCTICQKTYYSENAFQNHILSKAHKLKAVSGGSKAASTASRETNGEQIPPEAEAEFDNVVAGIKKTSLVEEDTAPGRPSNPPPGVDREEHPLSPPTVVPTKIPTSRCLFCNYDSPSLKLSVQHMTKIHGLFIPEQNYLVDLDGLVGYLQAKIHENHECLRCHKLKPTAPAVQTHMRDKGHCTIAFEHEEEMIEIGQFYDFSSTYSDDEEDDSDDVAKVADEEGWETDSDESSVASEEITSIPNDDRTDAYERMKMHRHHSNTVERTHRNVDGFHSHAHQHTNAVFYDENEMHLPSGRVAGHRSMRKYFRQNLHNYPSQAERLARQNRLIKEGPPTTSDEDSDEDMADADGEEREQQPRSQALLRRGEAGMLGVSEPEKRQVTRAEQRGRTKAQRDQSRYQAKIEKQSNNQKHFRDPLLQ